MNYDSPLAGANDEPLSGVIEDGSPPSTYAVAAVIQGQRGSTLRIIGLTAVRGLTIVPGLWAAGKVFKIEGLTGWKLVGVAMAASTVLSLGMLAWYAVGTKLTFLGQGGPK